MDESDKTSTTKGYVMDPGDTVMIENLKDKFTLASLIAIEGRLAEIRIGRKISKIFIGCVHPLPERKPKYRSGDKSGVGVIRNIQWNGNEYEYELLLDDTPPVPIWKEESQM